jgi:hypothetical protein
VRVEEARCLDLGHPDLREAFAQPLPADGTISWTHPITGTTTLAFAVGPDHLAHRELIVRGGHHDLTEEPQVLALQLVRCGFSVRWLAICECNRRARRLFVTDGSRLTCWRCGGLTYASAQQHDARLDRLRADWPLLEAAAANHRRTPALAGKAIGLALRTLDHAQRDLSSRSPRRRRAAAALLLSAESR